MTSQTNPKTVELYGHGPQHEAIADGTITPGMLVERAGDGVAAHSTAGGPANLHFANEFGMVGGTINTDYVAGDHVTFTTYVPGSGVYGWIADTVNAAEFALLASNGDGTLKVAGNVEVAVAQALEAVNNSAGGAPARIRVETVSPHRTPPSV